jgi:DNA end-binding protein Ku
VVVPREEMVKGYECAKDQYVTFTPEELEALEEPASPTIDLSEFVPLREVDPIYFDKAYYLAPEKGAEQSYRLLAHVLQERSRTAIARHAARGKQYLVMLRPIDGRLVMQQLRYAEEVRSIDDVPMHDGRVPSRTELKLAHQLVGQRLSETFRPGDYADEVRARILADIERKVQGKEVEAVPPAEGPRAEIVDLVEALKASIEAGRPKASKPRARSRGKTAA